MVDKIINSVSEADIANPKNFEYEGAHIANKKIAEKEGGTALLSSDSELATAILDEAAEKAKLEQQSLVDPLTGVGNFRALEKWLSMDENNRHSDREAVERRLADAAYPNYGVAIFIDADGLGEANKFGHDYGDTLLKAVASSGLEISKRPLDVICRRGEGSDEFVIFLPGDSSKDFKVLEKHFNEALNKKTGSQNFSASLAFGEYGLGKTARETVKELDEKLSLEKAKRPQKGMHIESIFLSFNQ